MTTATVLNLFLPLFNQARSKTFHSNICSKFTHRDSSEHSVFRLNEKKVFVFLQEDLMKMYPIVYLTPSMLHEWVFLFSVFPQMSKVWNMDPRLCDIHG